MSLLQPTTLALVATAFACGSQFSTKAPVADPCGLPAGVTLGELEPAAQSIVMRRLFACNDQRHGRITDAQYHRTIAALDAELAGRQVGKRTPVNQLQQPQELIEWASTVVDVSTQYSETSWSAQQVLGPPDVFPAYGDLAKAWASRGADDRDEWIEVGFDRPSSISGVEVFETFNPGAIDHVELITARGHRIETPITALASGGGVSERHHFGVRCTAEPIVSVRVHLNSVAVAGWNEIDAIGVLPCTR
jgi:hypothetical protein